MFLRSTDFPVPDGPRIEVIRPLGTSKVMSSSTVCEPNDFVTPRREMIGSPGAIQGATASVSAVSPGRTAACCSVSIPREPMPRPSLAPTPAWA